MAQPPQQGYAYNASGGAVVTQQPGVPPGQMVWMAPPQVPAGCPPGLEYLTMVDQLIVKQQVELLEGIEQVPNSALRTTLKDNEVNINEGTKAFTGFETNNKYMVCNSLGQQVYFAAEDTDCLTRQCCGPGRPFEMRILDNAQREVIHLKRPLRCDSCCFPCCLQEIEVEAPPGNVVGSIKQRWTICKPNFDVLNAAGDTVLTINGPFCTCSCGSDVVFHVKSGDNEIGNVSKQWSGFAKEMFTDAETFSISFPMDLDVNIKAVLMGALFLIDFMFFEHSNNN